MGKKVTTSVVKGGKISRSADSGRFVSVETVSGNSSRISEVTRSTVKTISDKRRDAFKRLADR
jgi:hypothetical protein